MKPQLFDTKQKLKRVPLAYLIVVLFTLLPILAVWLAGVIGNSIGCKINEAGTDDCFRYGIHFGGILSTMVAAGWLFFFTIPLGFICFIVLTYVAINDSSYLNKQNEEIIYDKNNDPLYTVRKRNS